MARPRTEFRNELKTRVPDPVYDGVKAFQAENGIDSESRAISKLLEIALFGTVGTKLMMEVQRISDDKRIAAKRRNVARNKAAHRLGKYENR